MSESKQTEQGGLVLLELFTLYNDFTEFEEYCVLFYLQERVIITK